MNKKLPMFFIGLIVAVPFYGQKASVYEIELNAVASLISEKPETAVNRANELIRKDKDNTGLIADLGALFLRAGKADEAVAYFHRAQRCKRISTKAINLGGDIARMYGKPDSALYYYNRAMYFDRKDPAAYYKAATLLEKTDLDKAVTILQRLKQNRPDLNVDKTLAGIYYDANKLDKALELYDAMSIDSLNDEDLVQYALSAFLKKDYVKSLQLAETGHGRSPRNPVFNRLKLYNDAELKNYDAALRDAEALFHNSDDAKLQYKDYIYYGYVLNGLGRTKDAIEQFNIALEKNTDEPGIRKHISDAYANIKDYDNAIKYYKDYLNSLKKDEAGMAYELYNLGRLYWRKGIDETKGNDMTSEQKEAIIQSEKVFGEVAALRPDSYLGYYWQGKANTLLDPNYQKGLAKPYFQKAAELLEASGNNKEQLIECYKQISYYYYTKKEPAAATAYARKIFALDPEDDYARQMLNVVKG